MISALSQRSKDSRPENLAVYGGLDRGVPWLADCRPAATVGGAQCELTDMSAFWGGAEIFCSIIVLRFMTQSRLRGCAADE
jgi:hypothetical protein